MFEGNARFIAFSSGAERAELRARWLLLHTTKLETNAVAPYQNYRLKPPFQARLREKTAKVGQFCQRACPKARDQTTPPKAKPTHL